MCIRDSIITNQLKDRDYSVTIEIKDYIERKGKYVILAQKDEEGFIVPGTIPENVDCGLVLGCLLYTSRCV